MPFDTAQPDLAARQPAGIAFIKAQLERQSERTGNPLESIELFKVGISVTVPLFSTEMPHGASPRSH